MFKNLNRLKVLILLMPLVFSLLAVYIAYVNYQSDIEDSQKGLSRLVYNVEPYLETTDDLFKLLVQDNRYASVLKVGMMYKSNFVDISPLVLHPECEDINGICQSVLRGFSDDLEKFPYDLGKSDLNVIKKVITTNYVLSYTSVKIEDYILFIVHEEKKSDVFKANKLFYTIMGFGVIVTYLFSLLMYNIVAKKEKSAARLKDLTVLLNASCLISETNSDNKIIYANELFCKTSGYTFKELKDKNHNMLSSGTPPKTSWKLMYRKTNKNINYVWNYCFPNINKKGNKYWVDTYIKKKLDGNGHIRIAHEVSELVSSKRKQEKANNILSRAGYMMRHDIKNPLIILNKYFEKIDKNLTEEQLSELGIKGTFNTVKKALDNLNVVYEGVYDFTLLTEDKPLPTKKVNLAEKLNEYLLNTRYSSYVHIDKDLGEWEVNTGTFINALDNLIRNSINYNESDKKEISIYLKNEELCIRDNGIGMSSEEFTKFMQPNVRGTMGTGTGLGLAISYVTFEKHGYILSARKLEQGTIMKLTNIKNKP